VSDAGPTDEGGAAVSGGRAETVLAYLASNLVDDPSGVHIEAQPGRNGGTRLSLKVAADDMGRVIGRRGRIAQSIRGLVRAAAAGDGQDVSVDIVDS
jgi:predicted RNA-binding protein YlqC (UPF0109 family)